MELSRVIRRRELSHGPLLEDLVGGQEEKTAHGRLLVARREYQLHHSHGTLPLRWALEAPPDVLRLLSRQPSDDPAPLRLLYLDTETTGLAGGTGTYAFLVGAGFFEADRFVLTQYFMRDLDEEPALISAMETLLAGFGGVVTYNGRGFDLPLLETRFVLSRRPWPRHLWHLDLLSPARRLWSARLPDCRLVTIEAHVLGVDRSDDVPGALIPSLYFQYLRTRHAGEMPRVFEHNRLDVLSLVTLTGWVVRALADPDEFDLAPEEYVGLGRFWEGADDKRGVECYQAALTRGLGSPDRERLLLRLGLRAKRQARWHDACQFWEAAIADDGAAFDPRPWEELAKYYEHRSRDLVAAYRATTEALARAEAEVAPEAVRASLAHRLSRLCRRSGLAHFRFPGRQPD
ncbi:MAG: ribonuclease H-like domain-containing protein [Candidatus Rokubacteria bacterium]|nr:ribonuclease H-like domain-containing protein [Candidatus Rokubacteria bacterium]